ncbi:MAG: DUF1800 domain-containing protein [Pirellulales bacterium]
MFAETQAPSVSHPAAPVDPGWAWAPYQPSAERPWTLAWAGHLYRRAAFGAKWAELKRAVADGPARSIDRFVRPEGDVAAFNQAYDQDEASASVEGLHAWWLRRMILSPHPLLEKMTLFWHGHFGIGAAKVKSAPLIVRHVQLLRASALGRFEALLQAVSRDPATLIALDATASRLAHPNETFPRKLLGQFALGPKNFTEKDVREAARAFTGRFILQNELRPLDREHDGGVKSLFGREGNWKDQDAVRIITQQPAASRWIVGKLYRWLISETDEPADALVAPLAESFAKDFDVSKVVETMLRSNLFFSPVAYRRRVKSPVELAVGISRAMEGLVPTAPLAKDLGLLGQSLCLPPTDEGWLGGRAWLNEATLLGRGNLAAAMLAGTEPYGNKLDPWALAGKHGFATPEAATQFLLDLFLQGDVEPGVAKVVLGEVAPPAAKAELSRWCRGVAHAACSLPEFQLS